MNQTELAESLAASTAQVTKIGNETRTLLGKIDELTAALAEGGPVTQSVQDALAALDAQVNVVDALVPDEVPPIEPPANP